MENVNYVFYWICDTILFFFIMRLDLDIHMIKLLYVSIRDNDKFEYFIFQLATVNLKL